MPMVSGLYFDVTEIQPLVSGTYRFDAHDNQVLIFMGGAINMHKRLIFLDTSWGVESDLCLLDRCQPHVVGT